MSDFWDTKEIKIDPKEIESLNDAERSAILYNLKLFIQEEFDAERSAILYNLKLFIQEEFKEIERSRTCISLK